jgi:hypothetical protein
MMQTLGINEEPTDKPSASSTPKAGFWRRQFQQTPTTKQKVFDWVFGVVLPLICVVADPIVFKGFGVEGPLLGFARPFAYIFSFASILMMTGWLALGNRLRAIAAPLAGLFVAGSLISLCVGTVLLPFSILGMFLIIGVLGFTPFFSSLVYFRNGLRAAGSSTGIETSIAVYLAALGAIFSIIVPYLINRQINLYLDETVKGDVATIYSNGRRLRYISPLVDADYFRRKSCGSPDTDRSKALDSVYRDLSGDDRTGIYMCGD